MVGKYIKNTAKPQFFNEIWDIHQINEFGLKIPLNKTKKDTL